jgi:hypothetical protein
LEHGSELYEVIRALIQGQRHLLTSTNISMPFRTLWTAALLDEFLSHCTNHEIGDLIGIVQGRFAIFEPEFALAITLGEG